jgi:hypothetical protein
MGGGSIGKWKITSYEACYDGRVTSCKSEGEGAAEVDADDGVEGRDGVSGEEGEDVGAEIVDGPGDGFTERGGLGWGISW